MLAGSAPRAVDVLVGGSGSCPSVVAGSSADEIVKAGGPVALAVAQCEVALNDGLATVEQPDQRALHVRVNADDEPKLGGATEAFGGVADEHMHGLAEGVQLGNTRPVARDHLVRRDVVPA